jgi:hypothetical protein
MDFSTDVMIEFGFNLAGYLIVALLVYAALGRRRRTATAPVEPKREATPAAVPLAMHRPVFEPRTGQPEFLSLSAPTHGRAGETDGAPIIMRHSDDVPAGSLTEATRRENREAIYREARRLLAKGKSRGELLDRLPVTEGEIEMLTATGKA